VSSFSKVGKKVLSIFKISGSSIINITIETAYYLGKDAAIVVFY